MKYTYTGARAQAYEAKRISQSDWIAENDIVQEFLKDKSGVLLDCPVGTGRFFPLYTRFQAVGLDISPDMLKEAEKKGKWGELLTGDVKNLPFGDKYFDVAVCIRLLNWFSREDMIAAVKELNRVSKCLIVGITLDSEEKPFKSAHLIHAQDIFLSATARLHFQAVTVSGQYKIFCFD